MSEEENNTTISSVFGQCVEVTEEHLDVWNHTNNVCYVQWMQDVAVEHSAVLGWDSKRYIDSGAIWMVRSHEIDYRRSTYQGDKLLVQTWIAEMKRASCIRRYRFLELPKDCDMKSVENECRFVSYDFFQYPQTAVIATAETHWTFVSTKNHRPVRVFPELTAVFKQPHNLKARFPQQ